MRCCNVCGAEFVPWDNGDWFCSFECDHAYHSYAIGEGENNVSDD